ncbi:hypothetical protein [Methylobacterium sp. WL2]|uniref:hypothetical protein n=1 Tax=Methylobacterium sp. WL2 TaxID=2603902 RepID=UPI00164FE4AD|nr:hypothetical protein [Methylobacterium sp. WL2]
MREFPASPAKIYSCLFISARPADARRATAAGEGKRVVDADNLQLRIVQRLGLGYDGNEAEP